MRSIWYKFQTTYRNSYVHFAFAKDCLSVAAYHYDLLPKYAPFYRPLPFSPSPSLHRRWALDLCVIEVRQRVIKGKGFQGVEKTSSKHRYCSCQAHSTWIESRYVRKSAEKSSQVGIINSYICKHSTEPWEQKKICTGNLVYDDRSNASVFRSLPDYATFVSYLLALWWRWAS